MHNIVETLKVCRKYIKQINHDAEAEHDNHGDSYMSGDLYFTMHETRDVLESIDKILKDLDVLINV